MRKSLILIVLFGVAVQNPPRVEAELSQPR